MYDQGNLLATDRGGLSYTGGQVRSSSSFGQGSKYFTAKLPSLFVLAAEGIDIQSFTISGGLGADGVGSVDGATLSLGGGVFTAFAKRVWNAPTPSVNHLVIVPGSHRALEHTFSPNTDSDEHHITGMSSADRVYYLLFASTAGGMVTDEQFAAIGNRFVEWLDYLDADGDGVGDRCDNCPVLPNSDQEDGDGDTLGNACDLCPALASTDQTDGDGDRLGDVCDPYPGDDLLLRPRASRFGLTSEPTLRSHGSARDAHPERLGRVRTPGAARHPAFGRRHESRAGRDRRWVRGNPRHGPRHRGNRPERSRQ
jgi:hypothetical protein